MSLRNQLINRIDVLNKVKELFLIPKLNMIPLRQIAAYYNTTVYAIRNVYQRHKDEIYHDGVRTINSSEFFALTQDVLVQKEKKVRGCYVPFGNTEIYINNGKQIYFSPRAVLRIGMLLRDSEVAKEVRTQLLNTSLYRTKTHQIAAKIASLLTGRYFAPLKNEAILAPFFTSKTYCYIAKNSSHKRKKPYLT